MTTTNNTRMSWTDGWHTIGELDCLIEDGKLIRGVRNGKTVYPYRESKQGSGLDICSGIKACKKNWDIITWR